MRPRKGRRQPQNLRGLPGFPGPRPRAVCSLWGKKEAERRKQALRSDVSPFI